MQINKVEVQMRGGLLNSFSRTAGKGIGKHSTFTMLSGTGANDRRVIWLVSSVVLVFGVWSSFAELARVVRADGLIVTSTRTQIVQNLEGGIITSIDVAEGDRVILGEELVRLDPTRFAANVAEIEQNISALTIQRIRLEAEVVGQGELEIPAKIKAARPQLASKEVQLFLARKRSRTSTISSYENSLRLKKNEVAVLRPLVETRAVSRLRLLESELSLSEIQQKLSNYAANQAREIAEDLAKVVAEIDILESKLASRKDQLSRTVVRAPASGVVNKTLFSTVGAVVGPGEPILEIVPDNSVLQSEVRVLPKDIGFISYGMRCNLSVTAYDARIYGTIKGKVVRIGADTVADSIDPRRPASFIVTIQIDDDDKKRWTSSNRELRNGMTVEATLEAQPTRVLHFILNPLYRAKEGLSNI